MRAARQIRGVVGVLAVLALLVLAGAGPAQAGGSQPTCKPPGHLDSTGLCVITGTTGGHDGGTQPGSGSGSGGGSKSTDPPKCYYQGKPLVCPAGYFGSGHTKQGFECWWGVADPQPPASDPVWKGHTPDEGKIFACTPAVYCYAGRETCPKPMLEYFDVEQAPPLITPAQLAHILAARLVMKPITIGIVPENHQGYLGYLGLPTWMWADDAAPDQIGPLTDSDALGGVSVSISASVSKIVWTMGDGRSVTCDSPAAGTPYDDSYGIAASPSGCGYRYSQPGTYRVAATAYWMVHWTGTDGPGEPFELPVQQSATTIRVGELQVLNQ